MTPRLRRVSWRKAGRVAMRCTIMCVAVLLFPAQARPETPEEWVTLGTRVHGGFGTFIPVGIRIGEDALQRLGAVRREVTVVYSSGNAPCPCVADGIAIATEASVGQGTLQVTPEKSPPGTLGVAVIRDKKTGKGLRYIIPATLLPQLLQWNTEFDPIGRYNAVMQAPQPFRVVEEMTER